MNANRGKRGEKNNKEGRPGKNVVFTVGSRSGNFLYMVLVVFLASGCFAGEAGKASPRSSSSVESTETVEPSSQGRPLSLSIEPCELFTVEDLAEYGEFESEYREGKADRTCHWEEGVSGHHDSLSFALSIRDRQNVETVNDNGAGVQRFEINQRPAAKAKNPEFGTCVVALKIDDVSRIDVTVVDGLEDDSCQIAEVVAELLEPRLPAVP